MYRRLVPDPVQHGPDERGQQRERRQCDEQGQRDPAAGLVHRGAEEQRPGQGDRDERVGGGPGRGQFQQPVQTGPVGPGRAGQLPDDPLRAAGRRGPGSSRRAQPGRNTASRPLGSRSRTGQSHALSILPLQGVIDPEEPAAGRLVSFVTRCGAWMGDNCSP